MTMRFSLKTPTKRIETMKELVESDMRLIVSDAFMTMNTLPDHHLFELIKIKVESQGTYTTTSNIGSNEKWILETASGKAAIFYTSLILKTIVIKFIKLISPDTKFYFLEEQYRNPFLVSFASRKSLPRTLRDKINYR